VVGLSYFGFFFVCLITLVASQLTSGMHVVESAYDLSEDPVRLPWRETPVGLDVMVEVASFGQVHDEAQPTLALEDAVELDDVLVAQVAHDRALRLQASQLPFGQAVGADLEGHLAAGDGVKSLVDACLGTCSQELTDLILPNCCQVWAFLDLSHLDWMGPSQERSQQKTYDFTNRKNLGCTSGES